MSHTYLTIEERSKIEVLLQEGYKISHITKLLGRHRSTIYRELNRCLTESYVAKTSQEDSDLLTTHKGRKCKHTSKLLEDIQHKLELTWSPEQIVGRDYQGILSFKTIYNWIYDGVLNVPLQVLRHKGKIANLKKHEVSSILVTPSPNDLNLLETDKSLGTGNLIQWFLHAERVKGV